MDFEDDDFFSDSEEYEDFDKGDEWKRKDEREAASALVSKWMEAKDLIYALLDDIADSPEALENETEQQNVRRMIHENAIVIRPKIGGAMATDMYILKMENASIIRTNAKELLTQVSYAELMGFISQSYKEVIVSVMNEFRLLFRDWVATFKKDEYEDDWGLFI